jgi:hypothetical protein
MKALLLTLALLSPLAHAATTEDVLFLDFNASIKEKKAAREAAKASGRGFRAYPDTTDAEGEEIHNLRIEKTRLAAQLDGPCEDVETAACQKLKARNKEVRHRLSELKKKYSISEKDFVKVVAEQAATGRPVSTLVISGHDGTGIFSGDFGDMEDSDIAEILSQHPGLKEGIRSMHLWGCNTTTPGSLMMNWTKHFPNAMFIAGYDDSAPANTREAGWKYLSSVMENEPKFQAIADSKKLRAALRAIPGVTGMHAAVYNCGQWASNKDNLDLNEYKERCAGLKKEIQAQEATWQCYLKAETEACRTIPADKANGPIRAFYRTLQKAEACRELTKDAIFSEYSRDRVIRLNFFDEIARNVSHIYGDELKQTDDFLERLGAPAKLRTAGIGKMSRGELRELIEGIDKFLREKLPDPMMDPKSFEPSQAMAMALAVKQVRNKLLQNLFSVDTYCTPFNWTEPEKHEESQCYKKNDLGNAALTAVLAQKNYVRNQTLDSMREALRERHKEERKAPSGDPATFRARQSLMLAQMSRLDASIWYADQPKRIAAADARVAWAEETKRLAESGQASPEEASSARALQYRFLAYKAGEGVDYAESNLKSAQKDNGAAETIQTMEAQLAHARLKQETLEKAARLEDEALPAEEKTRLAGEVQAGKISYVEQLYEQTLNRQRREFEYVKNHPAAGSPGYVEKAGQALHELETEKEKFIANEIKKQFEESPVGKDDE